MLILLVLGIVLILIGMFLDIEALQQFVFPVVILIVLFLVVKFVRSRRVGRFSSKRYDRGTREMLKEKNIIEGVARNVSLGKEEFKQGCNPFSGLLNGKTSTVLRFRVEITDKEGNIVKVVPAEIRGTEIHGHIADGDSVQVKGRIKNGIVIAKEVVDKTTNSIVRKR